MDDFLRTEADKRLRALTRAAHARGVAARGLTLRGLPHEAVRRAARARRVELVVLGTHGRTGLARALLGSVATRIIASAPCPVLSGGSPPRRSRRAAGGPCSRRTSRRRPGPPGGSRSGSRKPTGPGFASSMCGRGWLGVRGLRGPTPRRRARSGRTRGGGFRRSCGPRGRPPCARRRLTGRRSARGDRPLGAVDEGRLGRRRNARPDGPRRRDPGQRRDAGRGHRPLSRPHDSRDEAPIGTPPEEDRERASHSGRCVAGRRGGGDPP